MGCGNLMKSISELRKSFYGTSHISRDDRYEKLCTWIEEYIKSRFTDGVLYISKREFKDFFEIENGTPSDMTELREYLLEDCDGLRVTIRNNWLYLKLEWDT